MSTPTPETGLKTLAIRLAPDVHAQLAFIAQLREHTINDEGIHAIVAHIEEARTDPDLLERAEAARLEVEREAAVKREAISQMFGSEAPASKSRPRRSTPAAKADDTAG